MIYPCLPNRVARTYLGGHRIDALRGCSAPDGFYPEEWLASVVQARNAGSTDPNEGLSRTADGQILAEQLDPAALGGYDRLPILLKLLDASERLVIQAHPTAEFASAHLNSPFGKAECWYIISADPGAHVYLGFREGVTRSAWEAAFHAQDSEAMLSMLHRIDVAPGDVWFVDGGIPHAIGGGCLMAELQEPTDLMVVPEAHTPSGRPIAETRMHCGLGFVRMFDVFDYTGYSRETLEEKYHRRPAAMKNRPCPVIDATLTEKFRMEEYRVDGTCPLALEGVPGIAVILSGNGSLEEGGKAYPAAPGDCFFLPANAEPIHAQGDLRLLIARP